MGMGKKDGWVKEGRQRWQWGVDDEIRSLIHSTRSATTVSAKTAERDPEERGFARVRWATLRESVCGVIGEGESLLVDVCLLPTVCTGNLVGRHRCARHWLFDQQQFYFGS